MKALIIKPHSGLARNEGGRDTLESAPALCKTHGLAKSIDSSANVLHQDKATTAFRYSKEYFDSVFHSPNSVVRQEMPLKPDTRADLLEEIAMWIRQPVPETSRIFWLLGSAGVGKSALGSTILAAHFRRMSSGTGNQALTEENAPMAERFKNSFSRMNVETDIVGGTWYVTPSRCAGKLYLYESSQEYGFVPYTSA